VVAFKNFGVNMDSSSHLNDAWCDTGFIRFGRQNIIGQGSNIMSSMVVGKYLLIKSVIFGDYVMIGGHSTISPGTIIGDESIIGAVSTSTYNQYFKPGWIFMGVPAREFKENKYAEERRDILMKRDVDEAQKFEVIHEVNIDDDKKSLIKTEEDLEE
jgi:acetyltransferase-like isoleucine patch superfamily enzyme